MNLARFASMALAIMLSSAPASAASLSVSPIRVDIISPANGGKVTLRNASQGPVNIQVRVFKWSLKNGQDDFQETQQVVASPPFAQVPQNGEVEIRILRASGGKTQGEESYRLVIDEVPDANRIRSVGVNVALRYALPVFCLDPDASSSRLSWSLRKGAGGAALVVANAGDKHVRIADLALDGVVIAKGLAGYVLGNSTRVFPLPASKSSGGAISALTEQGRLDARLAP